MSAGWPWGPPRGGQPDAPVAGIDGIFPRGAAAATLQASRCAPRGHGPGGPAAGSRAPGNSARRRCPAIRVARTGKCARALLLRRASGLATALSPAGAGARPSWSHLRARAGSGRRAPHPHCGGAFRPVAQTHQRRGAPRQHQPPRKRRADRRAGRRAASSPGQRPAAGMLRSAGGARPGLARPGLESGGRLFAGLDAAGRPHGSRCACRGAHACTCTHSPVRVG